MKKIKMKKIKQILELDDRKPGKVQYSEEFEKEYVQKFEKRFSDIMFIRQEAGVLHNSFEWNHSIYEHVKRNEKEKILEVLNNSGDIRYGVLSAEPLRSGKNLVICLISSIIELALFDRIIDTETALTAADTCIQLVEETNNYEELLPMAYASLFKIADLIQSYSQRDYHYLVKQTKEYIYKHFHENIVIGQMSRQMGVSAEYLSRIFHNIEGITLKEFIQREKIERGKNLLVYSDKSIQEISRYLAFSTQSHFSAVFKKYTGRTPWEYRKEFSNSSYSVNEKHTLLLKISE